LIADTITDSGNFFFTIASTSSFVSGFPDCPTTNPARTKADPNPNASDLKNLKRIAIAPSVPPENFNQGILAPDHSRRVVVDLCSTTGCMKPFVKGPASKLAKTYVPKRRKFTDCGEALVLKGHDFSRAEKVPIKSRALAP
jgi:hypothetical protein